MSMFRSVTIMKLLLVISMLATLLVTSRADDITQLKAQVKTLTTQLAQTNQKLSLANQKIVQTSQEVRYLKMKDDTQNGVCHFKSHNPCDPCFCVEDYSMAEKYYCDCRAMPVRRDCKEHHVQGERINGLYLINKNVNSLVTQVFCDQTTDGGGWTLVQRRVDGSENFVRNWTEYREGFGRLHREHWFGNENLYRLTAQSFMKGSEVRFDMIVLSTGAFQWAKYSNFEVGSEAAGYDLHISGYSGNALDGMNYHDAMKFSTYDRDNDQHASANCALDRNAGWWFKSCLHVNFNGPYDELRKESITNIWKPFSWFGRQLKFSEIKVRRKI
eukprot:TCONS_00027220-protein